MHRQRKTQMPRKRPRQPGAHVLNEVLSVPEARLRSLGISDGTWRETFRLVFERPEDTAVKVLTAGQWVVALAFLLVLMAGLLADPSLALTVINALVIGFYLTIVAYKFWLIHLSLGGSAGITVSADELAALRDEALPPYTILVPLFHETESLDRLLEGLRAIDYPADRLQALLLLEEDDAATREAVRSKELPPFARVIVVPDGHPKTKPRACNVGLAHATGEYLVIYDAEDRPEPDQLKKAVVAFAKTPTDVICLQARLNFYNKRQNLLTRLFTLEYSMWFDLFLPGLSDLGAPIPLGGTSNHFRTARLRELMGWDPFNVTEDCDLGVRIARRGYATRMLDSTTWEEACSHPRHWIRQRSRWVKGYIQTYLVALRRPFAIARRVGLARALGFHVMVGGTPFSLLVNPLYWTLTTLWFTLRWEGVTRLFPFPIVLWGLVCLFAGNFAFVYATLLAAFRRGDYDLVKYGLLVPFYWLLMSVGAWKGFLQLLTRPSYWEKTRHGLDIEAGYVEHPSGSEEPAARTADSG